MFYSKSFHISYKLMHDGCHIPIFSNIYQTALLFHLK